MGVWNELGQFASDPIGYTGEAIGSLTGAEDVAEEAGRQAESTLQSGREARALNIERFGEAKDILSPYMGEARTARDQLMVEMGLAPGEAGTAYMETPGYESLLEERQRGVEQAAAGSGSLYSGARMKAASDVGGATQSQFYNNYMNLLQNIGSPSVATNVASMGVGQGTQMGQQQIQAQQTASNYMMGGAGARQAAIGDVLGGAAQVAGGAFAGGYI